MNLKKISNINLKKIIKMNKKTFLISFFSFFSLFIFSMLIWYVLVFAWPIAFWSGSTETRGINFKLTRNIYTNSSSLNSTILIFNSDKDIRNYNFISKCNIKSKFVETYNDLYLFEINFSESKCLNKNISLIDNKNNLLYTTNFNILSDYDIYSKLLDYKTEKLLLLKYRLDKKLSKYLK